MSEVNFSDLHNIFSSNIDTASERLDILEGLSIISTELSKISEYTLIDLLGVTIPFIAVIISAFLGYYYAMRQFRLTIRIDRLDKYRSDVHNLHIQYRSIFNWIKYATKETITAKELSRQVIDKLNDIGHASTLLLGSLEVLNAKEAYIYLGNTINASKEYRKEILKLSSEQKFEDAEQYIKKNAVHTAVTILGNFNNLMASLEEELKTLITKPLPWYRRLSQKLTMQSTNEIKATEEAKPSSPPTPNV